MASCALLVADPVLLLARRGMPPRTFVVGAALYISSVAYLMLAAGGIGSGLGVLLFMPVVGVALYGKTWESVVSVGFVLLAILAVTWANSPDLLGYGAPPAPPHRRHLRHAGRGHPRHSWPPDRLQRAPGADAASRRGAQLPQPDSWSSCRSRRRSRRSARSSPWASRRPPARRSSGRRTSGSKTAWWSSTRSTTHSGRPSRRPGRCGSIPACATPWPRCEPVAAAHRPRRRRTDGAGGARRLGGDARRLGAGLPGREAARRARHRQPRHLHPERMRRPVRRPGALPRARALQLGRPSHARAAGHRGGAPPHRP